MYYKYFVLEKKNTLYKHLDNIKINCFVQRSIILLYKSYPLATASEHVTKIEIIR